MKTISNHPHPNARMQRVAGVLAGFGIVAVVFAVGGLLVLGIIYGLVLMLCMIPFLVGLSAPLVLLTSLHPAVQVEEDGLRLHPLVFSASFVPWQAIGQIVTHTLLKPPPPSKLPRQGPHQGVMVMVQAGSIAWHYRVVGWMAGYGFKPVFAISNKTHVDYETLRGLINEHLK